MTINVDCILQSVSETALESLSELEIFREIGSTSSYLLEATSPLPGKMHVVIAESQTAGRGRRDKAWYSPPGAGLWMSVAYTFSAPPTHLSALTLALGATLAEELTGLGVEKLSLKWPNDILVGERKLGGILLESCAGGMTAVAGVGINTKLPKGASEKISEGRRPVDLSALLPTVPSMDFLAVRIIERIDRALKRFDSDGFEPFVSEWSKFDALAGREIVVHREGIDETGIAHGIAPDGALLLRNEGRLQRIVSGSVSTHTDQEDVA